MKWYKAINKNGKVRAEHRIIMEKMLGRPLEAGEVVHHIDGNKWNNDPSNLTIVTRREHALIYKADITRSKSVFQLDADGSVITEWPSARAASEATGAEFQNIYKCCRGLRRTAGGFGWRYKTL